MKDKEKIDIELKVNDVCDLLTVLQTYKPSQNKTKFDDKVEYLTEIINNQLNEKYHQKDKKRAWS